jgi:hypothetical protein
LHDQCDRQDRRLRDLIQQEARLLERLGRWDEAWSLLEPALDRERRSRSSRLDDEVRPRELVVMTSLLRIARHTHRADDAVGQLMAETVTLAEATPARLLVLSPSLLRDLVAEIGARSPRVLELATQVRGTDSEDSGPPVTPSPTVFAREAGESQEYVGLTGWQRVKQVANVVNLSTPLGLAVAAIGRANISRGPRGLIFATGYRVAFPIVGAFVIGNVVLTKYERSYLDTQLVRHEERHTWQYFCLLGLPMIPLYLLAQGWSWLLTGDPAAHNVFERLAGLREGGYVDRPVQPLHKTISQALAALRSPKNGP